MERVFEEIQDIEGMIKPMKSMSELMSLYEKKVRFDIEEILKAENVKGNVRKLKRRPKIMPRRIRKRKKIARKKSEWKEREDGGGRDSLIIRTDTRHQPLEYS